MENLITRALSAVVAVAILAATVFYFGVMGLTVLCFLVQPLILKETASLLFPAELQLKKTLYYLVGGAFFLAIGLWTEQGLFAVVVGLLVYFTAVVLLYGRYKTIDEILNLQMRGLFALIYGGVLSGFACAMTFLPQGKTWFLFLLTVIFAGDIGAYIVGSTFGKHKIMPTISPKKSVEGSLGGLAFSAVFGGLFAYFFIESAPASLIMVVALGLGFFGQIGDFVKSTLKRAAHVKDSGQIMPGHGGVLDRLDGVLFTAPIMYILASIFEKLF